MLLTIQYIECVLCIYRRSLTWVSVHINRKCKYCFPINKNLWIPIKKIIDKPRFKYDIYMVVNSAVGLKMATKYGDMSSVLIYQINCQLFYQLCFPRSFSVKILPCPCPHKPQLTYLFLFTLTKFILPLNADHTMPQGPYPSWTYLSNSVLALQLLLYFPSIVFVRVSGLSVFNLLSSTTFE